MAYGRPEGTKLRRSGVLRGGVEFLRRSWVLRGGVEFCEEESSGVLQGGVEFCEEQWNFCEERWGKIGFKRSSERF